MSLNLKTEEGGPAGGGLGPMGTPRFDASGPFGAGPLANHQALLSLYAQQFHALPHHHHQLQRPTSVFGSSGPGLGPGLGPGGLGGGLGLGSPVSSALAFGGFPYHLKASPLSALPTPDDGPPAKRKTEECPIPGCGIPAPDEDHLKAHLSSEAPSVEALVGRLAARLQGRSAFAASRDASPAQPLQSSTPALSDQHTPQPKMMNRLSGELCRLRGSKAEREGRWTARAASAASSATPLPSERGSAEPAKASDRPSADEAKAEAKPALVCAACGSADELGVRAPCGHLLCQPHFTAHQPCPACPGEGNQGDQEDEETPAATFLRIRV